MKKESKIKEYMNRIGDAMEKLDGKVSDMRHDSIEGHLGAIASNLEADLADQGKSVIAAQALADEAKRKADEAQRLADEAKKAAGNNAGGEDADDKANSPVKSKKKLFKEYENASKEELVTLKNNAETAVAQNPEDATAKNVLAVAIELLKKR